MITISEKQLIVGKMSESLARKFVEGTKIGRDGIVRNDVVRQAYEKVLKELDQIPSSPSTQQHLDLERLGGTAIRMKNEQQALFEEVRDAVQGLEDTLKNIGRDTSK